LGAGRVPLACRDQSIRDSLRGSLSGAELVEWLRAWTPPSRWTPRTRPHASSMAPHTRNSGHSPKRAALINNQESTITN
jgi:hypothetical protein